jgi:hypothetical protein
MNKLFNIHQWGEPEEKDIKTFIHNYYMNGREFPGWTMREVAAVNKVGHAFIKQYVWTRHTHSTEACKVDIIESFSYEEAKNQFQRLLQHNMRPLGEFKKVESALGPNAYVNHPEEMSYGVFLVANMVVRIHSIGSTDISCNYFIKEVYRILNQTFGEHSAGEPLTAIFSSKGGNEIFTRESTVLNVQPSVWYKLQLNGPGRVIFNNGNLNYVADTPGTAQIDLYTISEKAVVKNTLTLTVK